jgi:hypothetical protein
MREEKSHFDKFLQTIEKKVVAIFDVALKKIENIPQTQNHNIQREFVPLLSSDDTYQRCCELHQQTLFSFIQTHKQQFMLHSDIVDSSKVTTWIGHEFVGSKQDKRRGKECVFLH